MYDFGINLNVDNINKFQNVQKVVKIIYCTIIHFKMHEDGPQPAAKGRGQIA